MATALAAEGRPDRAGGIQHLDATVGTGARDSLLARTDSQQNRLQNSHSDILRLGICLDGGYARTEILPVWRG